MCIDTSPAISTTSNEGEYNCDYHPTKMIVTLSDGSDICQDCQQDGFCAYQSTRTIRIIYYHCMDIDNFHETRVNW